MYKCSYGNDNWPGQKPVLEKEIPTVMYGITVCNVWGICQEKGNVITCLLYHYTSCFMRIWNPMNWYYINFAINF